MASQPQAGSTPIGTLNEQPLHAALKRRYAPPGSRLEAEVDGFVVDVAREDLLVEIQTGNFSAIKEKITRLTDHHPLLLVYPIPREKWLLKLPQDRSGQTKRRKSPKRGRAEEVFKELVSFPALICRDTFSLEVVFTQEEEVRRHDPRRWRNRGWVTVERRLLDVVDRRTFRQPTDLASLLPQDLPDPFTTADLAAAMDGPRWLAQKMAYCLRNVDAITPVGRQGRSNLYALDHA
ncbi:MAG: hypothetical protein U9R72_14020 [Chloroflexota bacterium]|nr:hypothetical protein [Chloroflexota bacterium]